MIEDKEDFDELDAICFIFKGILLVVVGSCVIAIVILILIALRS